MDRNGRNAAEKKSTATVLTEVFTGIRPTGGLTVGNYIGAVEPTIRLQNRGTNPLVFVADLHALTTHSPEEARRFTNEVVLDYLALGLDPERADIFIQSAIAPEIYELEHYLSCFVTASELMRVPTLKEKVRPGAGGETASAALLLYPVLMSADILLQRARYVPVGPDQKSHLEMSRNLAERFNAAFGDLFPVPEPLTTEEAPKILGLKGSGKMGKSVPEEALFLADSPAEIKKKIRGAQTAFEGEMNEVLQSHLTLGLRLAGTDDERNGLTATIEEHLAGKAVMGSFKQQLSEIVLSFISGFQERRANIAKSPELVSTILDRGNARAKTNAQQTMALVRSAIRF